MTRPLSFFIESESRTMELKQLTITPSELVVAPSVDWTVAIRL